MSGGRGRTGDGTEAPIDWVLSNVLRLVLVSTVAWGLFGALAGGLSLAVGGAVIGALVVFACVPPFLVHGLAMLAAAAATDHDQVLRRWSIIFGATAWFAMAAVLDFGPVGSAGAGVVGAFYGVIAHLPPDWRARKPAS